SRRHAVLVGPTGVVTVVGGKLTTYRRMAQDAGDAAVRQAGLPRVPSRTRRLPLGGAAPRPRPAGPAPPAPPGAPAGPQARAGGPGGPGGRVGRGREVSVAEAVLALRHEGALLAEDVLNRRTRVGLIPAARAAAADVVAALPGCAPLPGSGSPATE